MLLKQKNAVITGCNRGIGKATLEVFAREGANVFATVRTLTDEFTDFCKKLESDFGVSIFPIVMDITKEDEVKEAAKSIMLKKMPVDILVNNAGILGDQSLFLMTSIAKQKEVFETNFFGQMNLTQLIAKLMMRNKKGSIINISSVAGIDAESVFSYVATKAAIIGATKRLAREFAASGIRVNAIAPGLTDTEMAGKLSDEQILEYSDKVILKRLAEPTEIANAILFLASDLSSYITGQTIRVDGGI